MHQNRDIRHKDFTVTTLGPEGIYMVQKEILDTKTTHSLQEGLRVRQGMKTEILDTKTSHSPHEGHGA